MLHLLSICCYRYHCRFFIGIKLFNLVFANIFSRDVCAVCLVTQSCLTLCDTMDCSPPNSLVHGDSPGKNSEVGCHALLQGVFPTQGSNPGLLHFRQILYHLSHQAIPWILEWIAYPFSRGSSRPRIPTRVSCIAGGFFASWATEVDKISQKNTFHVFVALYIK